MKSLLIGAIVAGTSLSVFAQGQVVFNNRVTGEVDARIFGPEVGNPTLAKTGNSATGTPAGSQTYTGVALGAGYTIELWAGANAGSLVAVPGTQTTFRTTSAAANGYINGLTATIPGFDGGTTPTLQVRVWDNAGGTITSYAAATTKGSSPTFVSQLLGGGTTALPTPNMIGLVSFNIVAPVPEPSTIALAGLGLGGLFLARRKKA